MKIFKKISLLIALLVPLLLTSCGGNSSNCGPAAAALGLVFCKDDNNRNTKSLHLAKYAGVYEDNCRLFSGNVSEIWTSTVTVDENDEGDEQASRSFFFNKTCDGVPFLIQTDTTKFHFKWVGERNYKGPIDLSNLTSTSEITIDLVSAYRAAGVTLMTINDKDGAVYGDPGNGQPAWCWTKTFGKFCASAVDSIVPELKIELTGIYTDGNINSTFEVTTDSIKLINSKLNRKR